MQFEWDEDNAAAHLKKHKVSFETAARVFADPFALTAQDRIENGEQRWQTIGTVEGQLVVLVAHTVNESEDEAGKLFASSVPARLTKWKGNAMKTRSVKYQLDLQNLPALTAKQRAEIAALAAQTDQKIDKSDIASLGKDFWKNAASNPFYKATKQSTTVRLDSDVLQWLKSGGSGYQTRLNAILRNEMLRNAAH
jgi:uncharacterized protein (DUF4415 family)/uncharacterized DUF497 family protein